MTIAIQTARTAEDFAAVAGLFREYAAWLGIDLGFQDFQAELVGLPGSYAPPAGELFLARNELGHAMGCVGIRPLQVPGRCEMKRLYVRESARGTGTGRALAAHAISFAEGCGYREMVLDTLPSMASALAIYRSFGFTEMRAYYDNPVPGVLFFRKDMEPAGTGPARRPS